MAQGATRNLNYSNVTYKLLPKASNPTQKPSTLVPSSLSVAAGTSWWTAPTAAEIKLRSDYDAVLTQAPDAANNITWRESGEAAEQYVEDITSAPASPTTFDIEVALGVGDTTISAAPWPSIIGNNTTGKPIGAGQYATLMIDMRVADGDGTIGVASGNAQGTLIIQAIIHNGLEFNIRTSDVQFGTLRGVRLAADGAAAFNYGQP